MKTQLHLIKEAPICFKLDLHVNVSCVIVHTFLSSPNCVSNKFSVLKVISWYIF